MAKVYVPEFSNGNCAYVYNSDVIRVYDSIPVRNSTISYKDYFMNSHYIYNVGETTFSQYSSLPTCIDSNRITTDVYYRNDFDSILVIFIILLVFCFYFPYRLISRMFGRWLKW